MPKKTRQTGRRVSARGQEPRRPAARASRATRGADEGRLDACGVDFTVETTADADLPPARGGVAPMRHGAARRP